MQAIIIFFIVLNEMKNGGLHLEISLGFFTNHKEVLFSMVYKTLWRSLAPFGVISGVDLVQALISGLVQLNRIK